MGAIGLGVLGMLAVLAMHTAVGAAFIGIGLGARRAFGLCGTDDVGVAFQAFWVGFCIALAVLMCWHFYFPVDVAALAAVCASGLGLGLLLWRRQDVRLGASTPHWALWAALAFWLWVANLSLAGVEAWDSALYHMQGVRWSADHPLVPGLANVFGPLAFNNNSFLYAAMMDALPQLGRGWNFASSLLVAAFGMQMVVAGARWMRGAAPGAAPALMLVTPAIAWATDGELTSYSTILPAALLVMLSTSYTVSLLIEGEGEGAKRAFDGFVAVLLATTAVAVKISAAVFAALVCAVLAYLALARGSLFGHHVRRLVSWSAISVLFIGGVFCARGIVLSGYPLFPYPGWGLPVAWAVPVEHARAEYDFVVHSALLTTSNYDFVAGRIGGVGAWFGTWFKDALRNPYNIVAPVLIMVLMGLLWALRAGRRPARASVPSRWTWLCLAPPAGALVAWFAAAPMVHYGAPFFWAASAVLASLLVNSRAPDLVRRRRALAIAWSVAAIPLLTGTQLELTRARSVPQYAEMLLRRYVNLPDPGHRFQQNTPERSLQPYHTDSGLVLNVPSGSRAPRCWDAPPPCTPNPAANLRLRVPGELESGFVLADGQWKMEHWPEPWRPHLLGAIREGWANK